MRIIYLDALFFGNLLADYLLCLTAARLCSLRLKRGRYLLAALFGAAYAAASVLPGLRFLSSPPAILAAGLGMGAIAFGGKPAPALGILTLLAWRRSSAARSTRSP